MGEVKASGGGEKSAEELVRVRADVAANFAAYLDEDEESEDTVPPVFKGPGDRAVPSASGGDSAAGGAAAPASPVESDAKQAALDAKKQQLA